MIYRVNFLSSGPSAGAPIPADAGSWSSLCNAILNVPWDYYLLATFFCDDARLSAGDCALDYYLVTTDVGAAV